MRPEAAARAEADGALSERARFDARGRERPLFVLGMPDDPRLQTLIDAFESGDYARVRREAPLLAQQASSPEVAAAALELRRRVDPDPLAVYLLMLGVALFAALVAWTYLGHGH